MLKFRKATIDDIKLYFDWTNEFNVREQSYDSSYIDFDSHSEWFRANIEDSLCLMLIFQSEDNVNIGQVRFIKEKIDEASIGISIGMEHRGNSYAKIMLKLASDYFLKFNKEFKISAFIKKGNLSSKYSFEKAGFELVNELIYKDALSLHYIKTLI